MRPSRVQPCSSPATISAFPASTGRSARTSPFSRRAQRSLTLRPAYSPSHQVTLYTEGFSHFVTSMTAPVASGGSKNRRAGFAPAGKAPPFHGARRTRGGRDAEPMKMIDKSMQQARAAWGQLPRCRARCRSGQTCKNPPIRGKSRCRMHGGQSTGRPPIHGRFSQASTKARRDDRALLAALHAAILSLTHERNGHEES